MLRLAHVKLCNTATLTRSIDVLVPSLDAQPMFKWFKQRLERQQAGAPEQLVVRKQSIFLQGQESTCLKNSQPQTNSTPGNRELYDVVIELQKALGECVPVHLSALSTQRATDKQSPTSRDPNRGVLPA